MSAARKLAEYFVGRAWLAGWTAAWLRFERIRRDNASWQARLRRLANDDPLPGEADAPRPVLAE